MPSTTIAFKSFHNDKNTKNFKFYKTHIFTKNFKVRQKTVCNNMASRLKVSIQFKQIFLKALLADKMQKSMYLRKEEKTGLKYS